MRPRSHRRPTDGHSIRLVSLGALAAAVLVAGCSNDDAALRRQPQPTTATRATVPSTDPTGPLASTPDTVAHTAGTGVAGTSPAFDTTPGTTTATNPTTSTTLPEPVYTFPFTGKHVSYGRTHHDYPAADVFGCGADVGSPVQATVDEVSLVDNWDPKVNDPATRGGIFVSVIGVDGVRYYFAHLASVAVEPGQTVDSGQLLGVMGQTGNARNSACHTHFGISFPCPEHEWKVRRGKVWPADFLDAWRDGEQRSPAEAAALASLGEPDACPEAIAEVTGDTSPGD